MCVSIAHGNREGCEHKFTFISFTFMEQSHCASENYSFVSRVKTKIKLKTQSVPRGKHSLPRL
jgi:hypothetical protein